MENTIIKRHLQRTMLKVTSRGWLAVRLGNRKSSVVNNKGRLWITNIKQLIFKLEKRLYVKQLPLPMPTVTVVTPVYNGATQIAQTLESVLSQDYPALEYIIVDGNSTDETLAIIRRYLIL